jgi:hypothetical protein
MTPDAGPATDDPVWYLAYGSNMSTERFRAYLQGGRPPGASREYAGCRDPSPPRDTAALRLPGRLGFTGRSTVWGGGLAVFDPHAEGEVLGRAYLVTFGQFSDVVTQEARRPAGADLARLPGGGFAPVSTVYDALLELGEHEGLPLLTMTSSGDHPPVAPSAAYLGTILAGLRETFAIDDEECVGYLLEARGVGPTWRRETLLDLAGAEPPQALA